MSKIKTPITILSMLILCCLSALLTYFILLASNVIVTDKPDVTVEISDASKIYDGNPLNVAEYEVDDEYLDKSHHVLVTFNNSITNVGTTEISANVDILDEKNNVVTDKYDLNVKVGKFEVLPKTMTISLNSVEKEYDGKPLTECDYEIVEGELALGHILVPYYKNEITEIGNTDAKVEAFVYDLNGSDVTANYQIKIEDNDAQLIVKKVNLKIIPQDLSFEYSGVALSKDLFKFETIGLLPDHEFVLTSAFQPSKYAFANNTLINLSESEYDIIDKEERSVKDFYNIVVVPKGIATVFPCQTVVNLDYTTTYTGKEATLDPSDLFISLKGNDKVASAKFSSKFVDVCQSQLAKVDLVIVNQNGENVTSYYNFEYNTRLTIKPITATVKYNKVYQYSGKAATLDTNLLKVEGLASGHTHTASGFKNEYIYVSDSTNNAEIKLVVKDNKGTDVTKNYQFEYDSKVKIIPYETTIEYSDTGLSYDGKIYSFNLEKIVKNKNNLKESDKIESGYICSTIKDAGTYGDEINFVVKIVDKAGNDVTENYSYSTKFKVEIKKRSTKVSYEDKRIYNGNYVTEIDLSKVAFSNNTLVTNDKLVSAEIKNKRLIKKADAYQGVELSLKIVDSYGNDVTKNYEFDFKNCKVTINPLKILILSSTVYINFSVPEDYDSDVSTINYQLKFNDISISGIPSGVTVKMTKSLTTIVNATDGYGTNQFLLTNVKNVLEFYDVDGEKILVGPYSSINVELESNGKILVVVTKAVITN